MIDALDDVQFHEMTLEGLKKIIKEYWKDAEKPSANFMFVDEDHVVYFHAREGFFGMLKHEPAMYDIEKQVGKFQKKYEDGVVVVNKFTDALLAEISEAEKRINDAKKVIN